MCIRDRSSAEQRAIRSHDSKAVGRVSDVYAAIPSMTGKFELEYEGELRGAENIAVSYTHLDVYKRQI